MKTIFFIILSLLSFSIFAGEKSTVSVYGINYPVWLERNQILSAVEAGTDLLDGDILRTGNIGRAWLNMQDGSVIKLGHNSMFQIDTSSFDVVQNYGLLRASLNILQGTFRFTTGFFKPEIPATHQVNLTIGSMNSSIHNTDIWGRSNATEDAIILLDGSISLQNENEEISILDQPNTYYRKLKNQPEDLISTIDKSELVQLEAETELSNGQAIVRKDGSYDLVLISLKIFEAAQSLKQHMQMEGYAVNLKPVKINGDIFYRLILHGFDSYKSAKKLTQRLLKKFQIEDAWVKYRD